MSLRDSLAGRLLLENLGLKLFSLAFAILLWMFVVGEKRTETSLAVRLELTRVPSNLVITSRVPETVGVRLSGPRTILARINPQQLSVELDLEGIQPGISTFENLGSRIKLPKRIEVTYASPSSIVVETDIRMRKALRVRPRVKGEPAKGLRIAELRTDPAEVEVVGAEKIVRGLSEIPTEVVDVTGLEQDLTRLVALVLPDSSLRRVSWDNVRLDVVLSESDGQKNKR